MTFVLKQTFEQFCFVLPLFLLFLEELEGQNTRQQWLAKLIKLYIYIHLFIYIATQS